MDELQRREWKERTRALMEQYVRAHIAVCERILASEQHMTRPERLEEIRTGIKKQARAYLAVMHDPLDDEKFALSMEVFDEIVDSVVHTALH